MNDSNIVLTGFMGTGKTSVGRALARLLDREFIDMDALLEARAHLSIPEMFAQYGQADFRKREQELCRELGARRNLVVATGGGALVNPENRAAFGSAYLICLDASVDEILRRIGSRSDRPLLQGDKRANVERLLRERRAAYAAIPIHIATDGRAPHALAQEVLARLAPRRLAVRTPHGAYSILLGHNLLEELGAALAEFSFAARCAVVTNPTVSARYAAPVLASLKAHGLEPACIEIPDGEVHKSLDTVRELYDQFLAARLERRSPVFALGGGVVGDTVGFAAATFLRGVPLVQIPTTLLAMVDSSIGGKVAVDHPSGKNLIGAFKFPAIVIADLDTLITLPAAEYRAGMAEVIKHAVIAAPELFSALLRRPPDDAMLAQALQVKIDIVERDPYEENARAQLNLGHTFGQALEVVANYQLRHGDAVAIGIAVAARLAANLGYTPASVRDAILALLTRYALPTIIPPESSPEAIRDAMGVDKKIRDKKLVLVLPRAIGRVELTDTVPRAEILRALKEST